MFQYRFFDFFFDISRHTEMYTLPWMNNINLSAVLSMKERLMNYSKKREKRRIDSVSIRVDMSKILWKLE